MHSIGPGWREEIDDGTQTEYSTGEDRCTDKQRAHRDQERADGPLTRHVDKFARSIQEAVHQFGEKRCHRIPSQASYLCAWPAVDAASPHVQGRLMTPARNVLREIGQDLPPRVVAP
jgi:hypothetical protein